MVAGTAGGIRAGTQPMAADLGSGQKSSGWMAPVLVSLIGAFMSMLDSSIVNVAIPRIMVVFNVSASSVQWVSTVYLLTLGAVVPLSGWLGDKLGFKRLYVLSLGVFLVGSLLCTLAQDLTSLIVARSIQALGGGMIMPTMMSMVTRIVPREKMGSGMGVFGIAVLAAPAIGPTLGGYLVEYVNWRWIFTINLPVGVIGILLALLVLPEFRAEDPGKLDVGGAITAAAGLFCLLLALSKGSEWGWGAEPTVLLFTASFFSVALFVYLELTTDRPLLDLRLFAYPAFTMANLVIVVTMVGTYACLFFLPMFFQSVRGIGAMETGLIMMPGAVLTAVMMLVCGKLYDRTGPRPLVIIGILLLAGITYLFHNLSLATTTSTAMLWATLNGMEMAFVSMPTQAAGLLDMPPESVGRASALRNIISRVSGSFGIAALTSMLGTRQAVHGAQLAWAVTPQRAAAAAALMQTGTVAGAAARGGRVGLALLRGLVARSAFMSSIDDIFLVVSGFVLIALVAGRLPPEESGTGTSP